MAVRLNLLKVVKNGGKDDSIEWDDHDDQDGDEGDEEEDDRDRHFHEGDSGSFDSYNTQSTHNPLLGPADMSLAAQAAQVRAGQLFSPTDSLISSKTSPSTCCHCCCHASNSGANGGASLECGFASSNGGGSGKVDAAVQTISTGDIVVTTVYFDDNATQT